MFVRLKKKRGNKQKMIPTQLSFLHFSEWSLSRSSWGNVFSLEPMTGMDMPFSWLTAGASTVRVPSNTGGLGGVILHIFIQTDRTNSSNVRKLTIIQQQINDNWKRRDRWNSLVAVEGQFDGIFHDSTAVTGWQRWRGVGQLHAGKSLRKEIETRVQLHTCLNRMETNPA